jgi:KRAB domain-containing zinc finger protein
MINHKKSSQVYRNVNKCKLCGKQFKLNFSYNRHVEKCNLFECEICGDFVKKTEYTEHMQTHEGGCSGNKIDFIPNLKLCKLNGVWKSKPNCIYKCKSCFEKFYTKSNLIEHMKKHNDNDSCTLNEDFLKYKSVPKSKLTRNPFKCQKCNLRFDKQYILDRHLTHCTANSSKIWNKFRGNVKTNTKKAFFCKNCGIGFNTRLLLNNHIVLGCKSCSNKDSWFKNMLKNKNLKQSIKSNINKMHNQNINNNDGHIMKNNSNVTKRSDQIDTVHRNKSTIMSHNLKMNISDLNIKKEKISSSNVIEIDCTDQTIATNSDESTLQTVPQYFMMNDYISNVKKERDPCTNTTEKNKLDLINATNYNESTSKTVSHNVTTNNCSSSKKKEKTEIGNNCHKIYTANSYESTLSLVPSNSVVNDSSQSLKKNEIMNTFTSIRKNSDLMIVRNNSNITRINSSDQINAGNSNAPNIQPKSLASVMYDHSLNIKKEKNERLCRRNVTEINGNASTLLISEYSTVKQEHVTLNDNDHFSITPRETDYLSIRKLSDIEKIPYNTNDCNLKSAFQSNFKFLCKICNKSSFSDVHTFALHMSDHAECSIHECIVCNEIFSTVLLWKNHMTYHQEKVDLNLSKTQLNCIDIESNVLSINNSESIIPQACSTTFRNKRNKQVKSISKLISKFKNSRYKNVKNFAKMSKKQYQCDICSKHFYSHLTLTVHQTVHNISRPFSCKYCNRTFSSKGPCTNHEKSHKSDKNSLLKTENEEECGPIETLNDIKSAVNNVYTFSCKYCERTFSSRGPCTNHEKSHILNINNLSSYNIKDKEHIDSGSVESQNSTNVGNNYVDKFSCNYCDRTFLSKGACTNHEKSHKSDKNNMLITENEEEYGPIEILNNIKSEVNNVNTISCKYCERTFSSRGPCTNHEKSHALNINNLSSYNIKDKEHIDSGSVESQNSTNVGNNYVNKFSCNYCDRTFLSKGACTNHEKSHKSDKNNMLITENEEDYGPIGTLNNIKSAVKNVNTISCKYCERTFSSRGPCTNHEKSHTTSLNYLNLYNIEDKEHIKLRSIGNLQIPKEEEPIVTQNKIETENGSVDNHENKDKVDKFVCFICKKIFTKHCSLINHIMFLHKADPNSPELLVNLNNMSNTNSTLSKNTTKMNKLKKGKKKLVGNSRFTNKPIACTICKKHFVHNGALFSHMNSHTDLKPYKCQYCDKKFNMKGPLTLHERTHKFNRGTNNNKILNKVKIEPNEEQDIGNSDNFELATKIFNSIDNNDNPFDTYDNKQNRMWFACDVCDKKFSTPFKLIIHRKSNCHVEPYVCKICNRSYSVRHRWNRHLKSHYIRNKLIKNSKKNRQTNNFKLDTNKLFVKPVQLKNQYKCSYCKKEYSSISYWKKHLSLSKECRRHCKHGLPEFRSIQAKDKFLKTETKVFECHVCKKTYSTAYNRKIHLINIHKISENVSDTQCKICGKNYSNKANLSRHYSVIHTKGNKCINCTDCGRTFKHIYSYQEHVRIKSLKLQQSNKAMSNTNRNLTQHIMENNKCNIVKYSCKICKMEFAHKIMLQRHSKTHTVTMYKCKDCNQLFKSNIILSKHILKNHSTKISLNKGKYIEDNAIQNTTQSKKEVPAQCKICFKVLKTVKYLSHHMRLHSGIKPFKCDFCNMAFRFKSNWRIHRRKHHLENMS